VTWPDGIAMRRRLRLNERMLALWLLSGCSPLVPIRHGVVEITGQRETLQKS